MPYSKIKRGLVSPKIGAAIALILCIFILEATVYTSAHFQTCINEETEKSRQQSRENSNVILAVIRGQGICIRCTGSFIYDYRDIFTAIATIAIAIFTYTLWKATHKLWEAGEKQIKVADASARAAMRSAEIAERVLVDLERPWLFIETINLEQRPFYNPPNNWLIGFSVRNIGRSPAIAEECVIKIQDIDTLPSEPDYTNAMHVPLSYTIAANAIQETGKAGPTPGLLKDGKPIQYVAFGRITYKELNGKIHYAGFAQEVFPHGGLASVTYKNKAYNFYD